MDINPKEWLSLVNMIHSLLVSTFPASFTFDISGSLIAEGKHAKKAEQPSNAETMSCLQTNRNIF